MPPSTQPAIFKKPGDLCKTKKIKEKMPYEIKQGREERLALLQQIKQNVGEPENAIQTFFKSITSIKVASTVMTFPPNLIVEA